MLASICAAACLTAAPALAVDVQVAKKGSYVYWFTYTNDQGDTAGTLPQRFKGRSTELDTEALGKTPADARLYVMDRESGNMAIAGYPPADGKGKALDVVKLTSDDFQYVRTVRLRVVSGDDLPLESALVNITDGLNTPMRAVVTPADGGVAVFNDVAAGEINVKVQADGLKRTIDSDFEIPEDRNSAVFSRDIEVSGDVDTLEREQAAASGPPSAGKDTRPAAGGGSTLLQTLVSLVFLVVIAAVVYVVLKSRGVKARDALRSVGVQFPVDQGGPVAGTAIGQTPAPGADPNLCQFCGQQKDASGNCSCTVAPGGPPIGSTTGAVSAGPRLVGVSGVYAGHIFELQAASAVIGRDAANAIALPEDSTSSRRHATISSADGQFTIQDEGSSNGTFVNGARVQQQKLTAGDEVQIGGTKFRFEL